MTVEQGTTQEYRSSLHKDSFCAEVVRPDTLDPIIWAGVVCFASSLGYLDGHAWSLFFFGAGVLVLIELGIRLLVPAHRRDLLGTLIHSATTIVVETDYAQRPTGPPISGLFYVW